MSWTVVVLSNELVNLQYELVFLPPFIITILLAQGSLLRESQYLWISVLSLQERVKKTMVQCRLFMASRHLSCEVGGKRGKEKGEARKRGALGLEVRREGRS